MPFTDCLKTLGECNFGYCRWRFFADNAINVVNRSAPLGVFSLTNERVHFALFKFDPIEASSENANKTKNLKSK